MPAIRANSLQQMAFELESVFRASRITGGEIETIAEMLKAIGKWMVLDRDEIQIRMGRKISLKYFDMMEEMGLIVDLYDPDHDLHLFQLGQAGYILLGLEHIPYQRLPLLVEHKQKGRILAFARWARKNGIEVDLEAKQNPSFIYFICKGNIIAYFKGYISPEQIIELYQEYVPTEIDELPIELSPKTAETYSTQGTTKEIAKALKKHAPK